jgi:hypothetical protein
VSSPETVVYRTQMSRGSELLISVRLSPDAQVSAREAEEKEALRVILEAHQRRFVEENSCQASRRRINELIANWRGDFARDTEHRRYVVAYTLTCTPLLSSCLGLRYQAGSARVGESEPVKP